MNHAADRACGCTGVSLSKDFGFAGRCAATLSEDGKSLVVYEDHKAPFMNHPRRLELEDGTLITYTDAQNLDEDIVTKLRCATLRKELYDSLVRQQDAAFSLVRHHLNLGDDDKCTVLPQETWIAGSFNVCIPIRTVSGMGHCRLTLRCCLP
ncbi:hypothetical protein B0I35DRAFT_146589 [Stachybotrys elegans]|uniref:Uncharacterized protein n=1 Tax=Stachybotrys elegans TaxID=80388 RepID=A0A8K0WLS2_9HYPO|nr:hypothetical protein B0I35DRAFT_146589 [Stachybotrys elegans]